MLPLSPTWPPSSEGRAICPAGSALTREQELTAELARAHEDLNVARKSFDAERTADREQLAAARKVNQSLFAALRDEPSPEGALLAFPRGPPFSLPLVVVAQSRGTLNSRRRTQIFQADRSIAWPVSIANSRSHTS